MRKGAGIVLSFLGAFLLIAGILGQYYAPGKLMKTPLDVDSVTQLSGTAQLSDGTGGLDTFDVRATSTTLADTKRSDDDVVSFATSSCLFKDEGEVDTCVSADDPQKRLLSASTDAFATDRRTALAVNDQKYLPAGAVEHEGLVNKWPFEAERKTYPYWDGLVGGAVDAVFDRTEDLFGLETYVYKVTVEDAPIELSEGVPGTYNDEKELFIDPMTGSIIKQVDSQERLDEDGNPFLLLDLSFTDEQVEANVKDAKDNTRSLELVTETLPLIGWLVGIPLLLIGLALLLLGYRGRTSGQRTR